VIRVVTASGGGYGDPAKRAPEALANDIRNGYVSAETAANIYGKNP
jgi:N-methylhydantoinase B